MRVISGEILLCLGSILASLVGGELLLRSLTVFPINYASNKQADPDLGYVLSQNVPGVDRYGFRNPDRAKRGGQIAAVGDSHTFGLNVASADSWPGGMERQLGVRVYNYGVPGYSPFQYDYLVSTAIADGAKVVIIGLVLQLDGGSDLSAPCGLIGNRYWAEFERKVQTHFRKSCMTTSDSGLEEPEPDRLQVIKNFFKFKVAITSAAYTLLYNRVKYGILGSADRPGFRYYRLNGKLHYRIHNYVGDVHERLESLENIVSDIDHTCRLKQVQCGYLILPSVGRAIHTAAAGHSDVVADVDESFRTELSVVRDLEEFFEAKGISYVDAAPFVGQSFFDALSQRKEFEVLLPWDHHPGREGYAAYAEAAVELLKRMDDGIAKH